MQSYNGSLSIYMGDNERNEKDPTIEIYYATDESTCNPNEFGFHGALSELVALLEGRK